MKTSFDMAVEAGFDEGLLKINGNNAIAIRLVEIVKREVKNECMKAVLDGCPSDGGDAEIAFRRACERIMVMVN